MHSPQVERHQEWQALRDEYRLLRGATSAVANDSEALDVPDQLNTCAECSAKLAA